MLEDAGVSYRCDVRNEPNPIFGQCEDGSRESDAADIEETPVWDQRNLSWHVAAQNYPQLFCVDIAAADDANDAFAFESC